MKKVFLVWILLAFLGTTSCAQDYLTHYLNGVDHLMSPTPANLSRAILSLEKSVELNPDFAPAYASLAEAYSLKYDLVGQSNAWFEQTLYYSEKARSFDELGPDEYLAYKAACRAYLVSNQTALAKTSCVSAIELAPWDHEINMLLGRIALAENDLVAANQRFRQALKQFPLDLSARKYLAETYARQGDIDEAEKILDEIKSISPNKADKHPLEGFNGGGFCCIPYLAVFFSALTAFFTEFFKL